MRSATHWYTQNKKNFFVPTRNAGRSVLSTVGELVMNSECSVVNSESDNLVAHNVHRPVTNSECSAIAIAVEGASPAPEGEPVLWGSLLTEIVDILAEAELDMPEVDAQRILEEAAGVHASELHDLLQQSTTTWTASRVYSMVSRRCAGEPLQYVLGRWAFRSLDLLVDRRVLIPRPETEVVAGWAVKFASAVFEKNMRTSQQSKLGMMSRSQQPHEHLVNIVDLGTGSGAIALAVAQECENVRVFATDVSGEALAVARANLAGIGSDAATRVTLHEGDWFTALPASIKGHIDVVVANPPYIGSHELLPPIVADWEPLPALRAGPNGNEHIVRLIRESPSWLRPGGVLILEIAPQMSAKLLDLAYQKGFRSRIEHDLAGRERVFIGVKR